MTLDLHAFAERLERSQHPIFLNHLRADGDSLGSNLALFLWARAQGKEPTVFAPDPINPKYAYLPGATSLVTDPRQLRWETYDCIVCADIAAIGLTGVGDAVEKQRDKVLLIDHHLSTQPFGAVNVVDSNASSTAELLHRVFQVGKWTITPDVATCLLTGIFSDSGVLRYALTSSATVRAAADLLDAGGAYHDVIRRIFETLPLPAVHLWGRVMANVAVDHGTNFAIAIVRRADLEATGATSVEGLGSFINQIDGIAGTLLLEEKADGGVKASLRARQDNVDVSAIAARFGGGGHKRAAGFYTTLSVDEILRQFHS